MDKLTFIVRIVEALAWPIVAIIVFWNVREHAGDLIDRMKSLKWKDAEASFSEKLDEVGKIIADSRDAAVLEDSPRFTGITREAIAEAVKEMPRYLEEIEKVSTQSPSYAIDRIWTELSETLRMAAQKRGVSFPSSLRYTKKLTSGLGLSEADETAIQDLRRLRNEAVYDMGTGKRETISSTDALRYRDLASTIISRIKAASET
jgi:hypothetical protein